MVNKQESSLKRELKRETGFFAKSFLSFYSLQYLTQEISERENNTRKILENLEFIKDQNNNIINFIKGKTKITEETSEPFDFSIELEKLTKTIKNLDINPNSNLKRESNPPIYKHWKPRK